MFGHRGHQSHLFLGGRGPGNDFMAVLYKFAIATKVSYFYDGTRIELKIKFSVKLKMRVWSSWSPKSPIFRGGGPGNDFIAIL